MREGDSGPSIALSKRLESFMRRKTRARHGIATRLPLLLVTTLLSAMAAVAQAADPADLQMHSLDGRPFSLDSLKGRVVVLDFWASWCVPCHASVPYFDSLQKNYGPKGLSVVGLTLEEDTGAIEAFVDSEPVTYPIVRDPTGRAGEAFAVVAMPTTFLIDPAGHTVARFEGSDQQVHAKLEAAVRTLLSGGTLDPSMDVRVSKGLEASGRIKAWQREYLADPIMSLDGTAATQIFREHVHASKEAAAGEGGASGGGCGCN